MNIQQAKFVKTLRQKGENLERIAELFYNEFGSTKYCEYPKYTLSKHGQKIYLFSGLEGNDIVYAASVFLNEKL